MTCVALECHRTPHVASLDTVLWRQGDATSSWGLGAQSSSTISWRAAASASAWASVKWTGFCFLALRHSRNGGVSEMMMMGAIIGERDFLVESPVGAAGAYPPRVTPDVPTNPPRTLEVRKVRR